MKCLALATVLCCSSLVLPQSSATAAKSPETATLRANARLVVVDVVVTGKNNVPLHGLKQSDFTVLDDKVPQVVKVFEEHVWRPAAASSAPHTPVMPPGIFTNVLSSPVDGAYTILLLDRLTTSPIDRAFFLKKISPFLASVRPGTSVAIFGLSTSLHQIQGFTSDPALLKVAIIQGQEPGLLRDAVDDPERASMSDKLDAATTPGLGNLTENLRRFETAREASDQRLVAQYCLDGFKDLAHYLSGLPGRKNVIWLSGGFVPLADGHNFEPSFLEAAHLLSDNQISVYPIDPQGLGTSSSFSPANDNVSASSNPGKANTFETSEFVNRGQRHGTLSRIASETGGHAFYNTNGFEEAVFSAAEQGASYYTLAFAPSEAKPGEFRRLSVKLAREGYSLSYRRGYYAGGRGPGTEPTTVPQFAMAPLPDRGEQDAAALAFRQAMGFGAPGVNQILYKVRILPAASPQEPRPVKGNVLNRPGFGPSKPPYRRFIVDYAADPGGIAFKRSPDGNYHAHLVFTTLIYQENGQPVNRVFDSIKTTLDPTAYNALSRAGFTFHQEVSVPAAGEYTIRTGIEDLDSGRIGSLETSIASVKNLPPVAAQAELQPEVPAPMPRMR